MRRSTLPGLGALALLAACAQPPRPAPADVGAYWPTYLGNRERAPFARQQVSEQPPDIFWSAAVGPGLRGMPALTEEVIITASTDRNIRAVSRLDGSTFWRKRLDGPAVSPLVVGDVIYTATEDKGRLRALNVVDGDDVWKHDLPPVAAPISLGGDTLYAATEDGSLFAIGIGAKEPIWRARFRRKASAGPLILDRWVVYIAYDSLFLLQRSDGQRRAAASSSEILVGEAASAGAAIFLATEQGSLIAWSVPELEFLWQASGFGNFAAGPVLAGDAGYAVTRTGRLIRFEPESGEARIIAESDGTVIAAPTVVQNGVLIGTLQGRLHFFSRNGEPIWEVELDGSIETPILVGEGRIIVPMYSRRRGTLSSGSQGRLVELR